jgi:signal transduction histidine kinase
VQPLAQQIDSLIDDRERQIEKARAGAADLAHGLKTSLQVLASDAQRLRVKGETEISAEIEEISGAMQRHVDRQLGRARIGAYDAKAAAGVLDGAERVMRVVERTPAGARLAWRLDIPDDLWLRIDQDDLAEILGNLVENASRHASSRVTISAHREEDEAVVTVIDDGEGIPLGHRKEALSRGSRLDQSGLGAGLGLAIVNEIAARWGGRVWFEDRHDGFAVSFRLPAVERPRRPEETGAALTTADPGVIEESGKERVMDSEKFKEGWNRSPFWMRAVAVVAAFIVIVYVLDEIF